MSFAVPVVDEMPHFVVVVESVLLLLLLFAAWRTRGWVVVGCLKHVDDAALDALLWLLLSSWLIVRARVQRMMGGVGVVYFHRPSPFLGDRACWT